MARRKANVGGEEEETVAIFVLSFNSRLIHISESFYVDAEGTTIWWQWRAPLTSGSY